MGIGSSKHEQQLQALLLGVDGSGKSSILARLCGEEVRTVMPTRGLASRLLGLPSGVQIKLFDVSGRRDLRSYWSAYFSLAQAIVYVIDASSWRRMEESSTELQRLLDAEALVGVPLLVLANKQDLPGALSAAEMEACLHLGAIRDRPWHCLACSALRKHGLSEGLQWLAHTAFPETTPSVRTSRPSTAVALRPALPEPAQDAHAHAQVQEEQPIGVGRRQRRRGAGPQGSSDPEPH